MYDFHGKGCFPAPHSLAINMPEFLQELYAKINECVEAVNECITLVDTSNNVVENWNNLKAECDMTMEQYANTMAEYANTMGDYTQQLEDLQSRLDALDTAVSTFEGLVEQYKTEVHETAEDALDDIAVLADSIVEAGTANGWYYKKYKSGRFDATKQLVAYIPTDGDITYDGIAYTITFDIATPFTVSTDTMLWLQPMHPGCIPCALGCYMEYFTASFQYRGNITNFDIFPVYCRLEGTVHEET